MTFVPMTLVGDDGVEAERRRPRVGPVQHLAAGRRRARPGGPLDARRPRRRRISSGLGGRRAHRPAGRTGRGLPARLHRSARAHVVGVVMAPSCCAPATWRASTRRSPSWWGRRLSRGTEVWQRPLRADAERNRVRARGCRRGFAEEGFDVGVAEIARRAGVGNATLFRRFPTKDALFEAIVDEKIAELCAAAAAATELPDPWDALVLYLEATAELQARDRGFFQATEQHLFETPSCCAATGRSSTWSIRWSSVPRRRASCATTSSRSMCSGWSRARSPACRPPPACAPTAGAARWPSC